MIKFGSLWIGAPLSKLERLALSSFIYHGYELTLFVYDMNMDVPPGIIKQDANQIISADYIFKVRNSYAPFADMFRYKMIQETGLVWTDTDNICLRGDWELADYCFGSEEDDNKTISNSILKAPKESAFIAELVNISQSFDKSTIKWIDIGPALITKLIDDFNLTSYTRPTKDFFPVNWESWRELWDVNKTGQVLASIEGSYTVQFWNQMCSLNSMNKNNVPPGSVLDLLLRRYS